MCVVQPELNSGSGAHLCLDIAESHSDLPGGHSHFQWPWNRKKVHWRYGEVMQRAAPEFGGGRARPH